MRERDGLHLDVFEARFAEQPGELALVGEAEHGRPDRQIRRRRGSRRGHRVHQHADEPRLCGKVPDRQGDPAAGRQHARELGRRALRASEMEQQEVRDQRVEARGLERERFGAAGAEFELWTEPARQREHALGNIDTDDGRAALGSHAGDVAGTTGDIEHAGVATDGGGIQQWRDEPRCDRAEEVVVAGDLSLPARRFERVERVRVDRRISHTASILRRLRIGFAA